jgi:Holliday junction resolvasome RuvABC endonuclease subunit
MRSSESEQRILAIDPTQRGFGYVIFEGPNFLVDWGVRDVGGAENPRCAQAVARLIEHYTPSALILEDASARGCRRGRRVRDLLGELTALGTDCGARVRRISRTKVRTTFAGFGASNKHQIARVIAALFPELASRLPPERKPWMSEDQRMAIFDAAALALTLFKSGKGLAT